MMFCVMWEAFYWTMPPLDPRGSNWTELPAHALHFATRWQAEAVAASIGRVEAGRVVEMQRPTHARKESDNG